MTENWGLLGPEFLPNQRRTRALGLSAVIRRFNDLAVPGIGGVWFGKQILLATLGVAVAEDVKKAHPNISVNNIEVTNAIEALACWLAFKKNNWQTDSRLRGNTKLRGKEKEDLIFKKARHRSFYVTQPMRMATVQTLPALGFVESNGERFNNFSCSDHGRDFINNAFKKLVIENLSLWVRGDVSKVHSKLFEALSPLVQLDKKIVIPLLRERLTQGGNEPQADKKRRIDALNWVEFLRKNKPIQINWEKPDAITDEHWDDLRAGALFFKVREEAINTLDAIESLIANQSSGQSISLNDKIHTKIESKVETLKSAAQDFIDLKRTEEQANRFCEECLNEDSSGILRSLVVRDDRVLRLVGNEIKPGPAFSTLKPNEINDDIDGQDTPSAGDIVLPENISYRIRNLYLLNLDMKGELDVWINPKKAETN